MSLFVIVTTGRLSFVTPALSDRYNLYALKSGLELSFHESVMEEIVRLIATSDRAGERPVVPVGDLLPHCKKRNKQSATTGKCACLGAINYLGMVKERLTYDVGPIKIELANVYN